MKKSRLLRWLFSFALMLGVYGAYALAVVPFIEPTVSRQTGSFEGEGPFNTGQGYFLENYGYLFAEDAWEVEAKIVQLESAVILMQDYQPLENGQLEIKPCTVIYQAQGDSAKRPIIMQAPEGAILRFDELDLAAANIGKLQGGLLKGDITIWSPETEPGAGDRLDIQTYNVQLEKQRVLTPHDVSFRYGESYGSGRDLNILLASSEDSGGSGSPMGAVQSIELVQVDQIYLVPPPQENATESAPLQITCEGSFFLDLVEQVANFNEQVDVHRLHVDGPSDQLQCEQLSIFFEQQAPAEGETAPEGEAKKKLELSRILARGTPVIGRGPSFQAEVRGEMLEFDFKRRILDLAGEGGVWLRHGSRRIDAPRVQYQLAEEGRLGRAWAPGPGRVVVRDEETGEIQLNASWQTDVQLRPHEGMHVLSLYGDAQAGLGPAGGIRAKEIHVWMREEAEPADPAVDDAAEVSHSGIVPDRMMADGGVTITSPQLVAHTRRVELWLEDRTPPGGENPATPTDPGQPGSGIPSQPAAETPPAERLQVAGDLLRVLLIRQDAEWIVENLTLDGGVELVQMPGDPAAQPLAPTQPPLRVVGDFLQMRSVSQTGGTVSVQGAPAVVEARDVVTRGDNIQLDRQQNRLWIEGPGQLDLPLKGDLIGQPNSPPQVVPIGSSPVAPPRQRAIVTWSGGLDFNGQVFRFDNEIVIDQIPPNPNEGTATHVTGQQLEVVLDRAIDFARPETDGQIQVRQVALSGNVDVQSQTLAAGQLVSRDSMQAARITFDPPTGNFAATGPGVVKSTRRGTTGSLLPSGTGGAPQPSQGEQGINYLQISFNKGINGNSNQRQLAFFDRVVTLYGPVDEWNQTLAVPAERAVPRDIFLLTCERLQVAQVGRTANTPGWMELVAQGNTVAEGYNFTARGMRMSYTEEKELLVMEGDGRSSVQLWRRTDTGEESSLAARKIFFDRRTSGIRVQDVTSFDLSDLGVTPPTR